MPIISSGAVSPGACAMPMIVPVSMPGIASGNTWCVTTCDLEAPTPSAASRIDGGTALDRRARRDDDGRQGHQCQHQSANQRRGSWHAEQLMKMARPSGPNTIDGTAARLLMLTR